MCGVDLPRIDGIDVTTAPVVVSEIGTDMSRFPTGKHFASWLGLCPCTKGTGGLGVSGKTKRCANRAAEALRLAAAALGTSQSARLIYSMLSKGEEYTNQGQAYGEERYRQRVLHNLNRRAQQLGMTLVPTPPAAQAA